MKNLLEKTGLKNTPCRLAIIELLSKSKTPFTAEVIHQALKKIYDLATIYRNLESFEKKGLVFKETISRVDYYYLGNANHHIICRVCSAIECVPCNHHKFNVNNFTNISHQLLLTGVCNRCAK